MEVLLTKYSNHNLSLEWPQQLVRTMGYLWRTTAKEPLTGIGLEHSVNSKVLLQLQSSGLNHPLTSCISYNTSARNPEKNLGLFPALLGIFLPFSVAFLI